MEAHHKAAIERFLELYKGKDEYIGILLAGSLAHGHARPDSDIDIILIATPDEYRKREAERKQAFSLWDICTYPGGYIDCKVVSLESLRGIAEKGSDAARYAFKDARVLTARSEEIPRILERVTRFPEEQAQDRRHRFACQLLAWKWYMSQAEEKRSRYLTCLAAQKITLFSCRLILNENRLLYPYHKWLLAETGKAENQPPRFMENLTEFLEEPRFETAQRMVDDLFGFLGLREKELDWPNRFMIDSEMNWVLHEAPVDDL